MQRAYSAAERTIQHAKQVQIISNFEYLKRIEQEPPLDKITAITFPQLCNTVDGFIQGELVVVTGATGCGKTLFCQSLTKDFCNDGVVPLWFTYEVTPRFFLRKFALNAVDLQFFLPAELVPYSIEWVTEVIKRGKQELGVEVVFLDHLHYIFDMSRSMHASLDIGMVVRTLKRLCVEHEIIIFLCCHTTKSRVESTDDVGLHKIRDSSLVAQEADTVIFVHRTTSDDGICKTEDSFLKVCKARRTGDMSTVIETTKPNEYLAEKADE